MGRFDVTETNAAVERLIAVTENPRHLYLLAAYNRHRYLEQEIESVYRDWTENGQCIFYVADERLAVGDNSICSTAMIGQQTPGSVLAAGGADVDPDATYVVRNVEHMIWLFDDRGRLIGEDVWEIDESKREVIELEPAEVLTHQAAAKLVERFIKPLPDFDSAVDDLRTRTRLNRSPLQAV
jgi:hypothetical protein